jgi:hypothetical protein
MFWPRTWMRRGTFIRVLYRFLSAGRGPYGFKEQANTGKVTWIGQGE